MKSFEWVQTKEIARAVSQVGIEEETELLLPPDGVNNVSQYLSKRFVCNASTYFSPLPLTTFPSLPHSLSPPLTQTDDCLHGLLCITPYSEDPLPL